MTREEASFILANIDRRVCDDELNDALDMAIKAVEQEPCEDCISRKDTLKAMIERLGIKKEDYLLPEEATLYKVVKNMPPVTSHSKTGQWAKSSSEKPNKWIPVSERLPEEHICDDGFIESSEYVLVQLKSRYMEVSRYWGNNEKYKDHPWIDLSYPTVDEVVAWMPLPELYKAESENEAFTGENEE